VAETGACAILPNGGGHDRGRGEFHSIPEK
jgi:hypothetical protein